MPESIQSEDFSAYPDPATFADWLTDRGNNADGSGLVQVWDGGTDDLSLDHADLQDGNPALVSKIQLAPARRGPKLYTAYPTRYEDVTYRMSVTIDATLAVTGFSGDGLWLFESNLDSLAGGDDGGIVQFGIDTNDRLVLNYYNGSTNDLRDLGPSSDVLGTKKTVHFRFKRTGAATFELSVYIDAGCTDDPTHYATEEFEPVLADGGPEDCQLFQDAFTRPAAPGKEIRLHQFGYASDSEAYGIAA